MSELIDKLRAFIKDNKAGALLVNSTSEFLVEYNLLENNSRFRVTGFSGSTGDALLTMDKLYLFVDGRYHEQADFEVDKSVVSVVKLKSGNPYLKELVKRIPKKSVLLTIPSKNSNYFEEQLKTELTVKDTEIKHLNSDIVEDITDGKKKEIHCDVFKIMPEISSKTPDEKFKDISKSLKKDETIIITSLEDVAYLTDLRSFDIPYSSSFFAKAIITKEKTIIFSDCNLPQIGVSFEIRPLIEFDKFLTSLNKKTVYLNEKAVSAKDYELIDASNIILPSEIYKLKTVKGETEIQHFKSAFNRTDKALAVVEDMINSKKIYSELDFYNALEKSFYNNGAKSLSFKPIVATGKNSSVIHYSHSSKDVLINDGDLLLIDCGAYYEGGYATDITRTFIKGKPSPKQKRIYTTVLKAFLNAYSASYSANSTWYDIDKKARKTIDKQKNAGFIFSHSTGHGVGISVHEAPPVVAQIDLSKSPIQNNTVFTIEPGIYKKNWGGVRLENTVLSRIADDKVTLESLSKFKFEDKLIDYDMLTVREKKWLKNWQENSNG